jgi:hypothetical protein
MISDRTTSIPPSIQILFAMTAACYHCNEFKGAKIEALDPETQQVVPLFNPRIHLDPKNESDRVRASGWAIGYF